MFLYCANKKVLKFWLFAFKYLTTLSTLQRCDNIFNNNYKINLFIKKDFRITHTYVHYKHKKTRKKEVTKNSKTKIYSNNTTK